MNNSQFRAFIHSTKEYIPFEISNTLAHIVLEDFNLDDDDLIWQEQYIDSGQWIDNIKDYEYTTDEVEFWVKFLKGLFELIMLVPENERYMYDE
jgi:hypothetical protein